MEMAAARNASTNAVEWRVTVPEGASSMTVEKEAGGVAAWAWLVSCVVAARDRALGFGKRVWKVGADDPRRAVHGLKVGLALSLVSVFYYTRPLYEGVGGAAMWAVMTVVVVFEYTVGGCVYKGFNRAAATASAGVLALGVHWIASNSGDTFEPFIRSGSVFLLAATATFFRFIPTVKARYDYGIIVFILTYCLVAVSGYRVDALRAMALERVSTISIGVGICLAVSAFVRPVWAGQELHRATARNMDKLAAAVEACFSNSASAPALEGNKCVLNSKASEDSLANLARWEPAHGAFGFRHPYGQYGNVGAAMRRCAYCVEALAGCIRSSSAAETTTRHHLAGACTRVATQCASVLREAASSVRAMTASPRSLDLAVVEMNAAVQDLQADVAAAFPSELTMTTAAEEAAAMMMHAAHLFTVTTLLIELSARVEDVVDAVDMLVSLAAFKPEVDDDEKPAEPTKKKCNPLPMIRTLVGRWRCLEQA